MLDTLKELVAKKWAGILVKISQKRGRYAIKNQETLLLQLVKKARDTEFGKDHDFRSITNLSDFQNRVSIADYEDLRPYIDKLREGQANILWPGTPKYFAKTSGTTSGAKFIPISYEGIRHQVDAAKEALLFYIYHKGDAKFVHGKMIFLQGSPKLKKIHGIKTGRLSGIVAHYVPDYLQRNRLPSWKTNMIKDWDSKVDKIVEETELQDMTLISGIPPWLIMYFEKLIAKNGKKVKDIFPNLQLIVTGGVNYEPYRNKINDLIGRPVDIVQTYPASEGFFAYQDDYHKDGLLLITNKGIFYEFIPKEDFGKPDAPRLSLGEIELNKDYAMIISTNSGLWAYAIGDVIRFISKNPYKILVSGRIKHFTSAFGEHVIAYEVEEALKLTLQKFPAEISEFHLAPEVTPKSGLPFHEWLIEFAKEPSNLTEFAHELDHQLRQKNSYYDDLIKGNVLRPLVITRLKKNAFIEYSKSVGKLGGQNKTPRLANDRKIADFLYSNDLVLR